MDKQKEAAQYKELIQKLVEYQNVSNIIAYLNNLKNEKINNLRVRVFYTINFNINNLKSLS